MRETFRTGSDLQDDLEALARLDRVRPGEPPTQTLKLGKMAVERGDNFRVHSTPGTGEPDSRTRTSRTGCSIPPGMTVVVHFFFLAFDFLSFLFFFAFFAIVASLVVIDRRAA